MDKKKILVVDDSKLYTTAARNVLENEYEVYTAMSAQDAFAIMEDVIPDLILLDIVMPGIDGYKMLELLQKSRRLKNVPVVFLTGETDAESEIRGFDLGAVDFITKPFVESVMKRRIKTQLQLSEYNNNLEQLVQAKVEENEALQNMLTIGFAELVESRDGVTGGHVKNTLIYFEAFINRLKTIEEFKDELTDDYVKMCIRSAPLHDIGKIGIDDVVLRKQAYLENDEMEYMQTHSTLGGQTIRRIRSLFPTNEFLKIAEDMALYHHERWDGRGYPEGLAGEDIPLCARIMSVVDVYDALTSERPYKKPFPHEKAMAIIMADRGMRFDPDLVDVFTSMSDEMRQLQIKKVELRNKLLEESFSE